jgi:hypothetical protein
MLNIEAAAVIASTGLALYAGHHLGDYWVQTDHDAACKGKVGWEGRLACLRHVASYTATQAVCLALLAWVIGGLPLLGSAVALGISAGTHYLADRREFGIMFRMARLIPGKANFLKLGAPRPALRVELWEPCPSCGGSGTGGAAADESTSGKCWDCRAGGLLPGHVMITDNPSLGTGAWALDQAWHIALGVFLPALILGAFA